MLKIVIILICLLTFFSCKTRTTVLEVPVETIKVLYIYRGSTDSILSKDSIYIHDSVFILLNKDTIYLYVYKFLDRIKYLDRIVERVDSFLKIDSIPYIVRVTETVEVNVFTWFLKLLMYTGGIVLFLIAVLVLYKILKNKIWK